MGYFDTKEARARQAAFEEKFKKSFGDETLVKGIVPYEVISSGSINLDLGLGVGGYVKGRIVEIWGPQDSGKTTLGILGAVEAQKAEPKKMTAVINVENKWDGPYAEALGLNLRQNYLYTPGNAEETADALKFFLEDPLFSYVLVDSVGAMMGRVEQEKQADESVVAVTARIVTRMVKHATFFAPVNGAIVVFLNQVRETISAYGSSTTTPGGRALKHGSTFKIKLGGSSKPAIVATVKGERIPIGKEVAAKIERNKCYPPGSTVFFLLKNVATDKYGPMGVDKVQEAFTCGVKLGLIQRTGNRYTCPITGEIFVGKDPYIEYLRENPKTLAELRERLIKLQAPVEIEEEPDSDEVEITEADVTEEDATPVVAEDNPVVVEDNQNEYDDGMVEL